MKHLIIAFVAFLSLVTYSQAAIVTVSANSAEVLSSPDGVDTYVVLNAPRYYPLSVRGDSDGFYAVVDYLGRSGWVRKSLVSEARGVVVEVDNVNVRSGPGLGFSLVFRAGQGVTFKVVDEKDGWLQVVHESGQKGWVFKSLTWGQ